MSDCIGPKMYKTAKQEEINSRKVGMISKTTNLSTNSTFEVAIVLEILSQHCSRLLQDTATMLP
jgi:hypothetical protein